MAEEVKETPDIEVNDVKAENYKTMQEQIDELTQQVAIAQTIAVKEKTRAEELNNLATRIQADFDNYRRRTLEASKRLKEDGIVAVIEKIVPALDVIQQAVNMITDSKVAEGVQMIHRQLTDLLVGFGVTEIIALGEEFDPNLHNAIMKVDAKTEDEVNKVVEVFQSGYRLGDRIIKHSVVKVAN